MTRTIEAHFDNGVVVLDEPLSLPNGTNVRVLVDSDKNGMKLDSANLPNTDTEQKLDKWRALAGWASGPEVSLESLRRENLYGDAD